MYLELHQLFNALPRLKYPFDSKISKNGLYILFEEGEKYMDFDRIVRIGSHDGDNRLAKRVKDHFVKENQRISVFRKHIGRCFLNKSKDKYLNCWNLPFKKIKDKEKYKDFVDLKYELKYEQLITDYIRTRVSLCIIPDILKRSDRDRLEQGLIAILAQSSDRCCSETWLGNYHPDDKIRNSKLWNLEYCQDNPITKNEFEMLKFKLLKGK